MGWSPRPALEGGSIGKSPQLLPALALADDPVGLPGLLGYAAAAHPFCGCCILYQGVRDCHRPISHRSRHRMMRVYRSRRRRRRGTWDRHNRRGSKSNRSMLAAQISQSIDRSTQQRQKQGKGRLFSWAMACRVEQSERLLPRCVLTGPPTRPLV